MTEPVIEISALDHVHLYAADPVASAAWYRRILGLQVLPSSGRLSHGVYLATSTGHYCATLFRGAPPSDGDHTTAFRVTGRVFMAFGNALPHPEIYGRAGSLLRREELEDHDLAFSYYFRDPDGNHLELVTYDHRMVRARLED